VGVERSFGLIRIVGTLITPRTLDSLHPSFIHRMASILNLLLHPCTCLISPLPLLVGIPIRCNSGILRIGQGNIIFRGIGKGGGAQHRQRQEEVKPKEDIILQPEDNPIEESDKMSKVTCFNCAEWGHFSTDYKAPKLCLIYETVDHVGRNCPEWEKPMEFALYLGSAAQGLGFFHVEVQEEENKGGYLKFLDNCAVLTIEEGEIEVAEIIENLQGLFDKKWHW
jgi:hypothetical protein